MKAYLNVTSLSVPGWPPGSASSGLHEARYYFWYKNCNPDPRKPICRHIWRHITVWPPHLYLAGLQDQLLETSRSLQVKSSWPLVSLNKVKQYYLWIFQTKNVILMESTILVFLPLILELDVLEQAPSCPRWSESLYDFKFYFLS